MHANASSVFILEKFKYILLFIPIHNNLFITQLKQEINLFPQQK